MKKLFFYAMMMVLAGFTMTSCETDEEIARRLTGVDWEGDLDTYYMNRWGDAFRDGEYRTVWRFEAHYYDRYGEATHGWGEECDYDYHDRYSRAYSSFRWEVRNGNIYIYYDDPTWNNVRIDWYDYTISYSHFHGTMYDWDNRAYHFNLYSNSSWRWDDYRYDSYYDGWGFLLRTRAADDKADEAADSTDTEIYVSENGKSYATGKFAKALNEMAAAKK